MSSCFVDIELLVPELVVDLLGVRAGCLLGLFCFVVSSGRRLLIGENTGDEGSENTSLQSVYITIWRKTLIAIFANYGVLINE